MNRTRHTALTALVTAALAVTGPASAFAVPDGRTPFPPLPCMPPAREPALSPLPDAGAWQLPGDYPPGHKRFIGGFS